MDRVRCLNCGFLAPRGGDCPRCEGETALGHHYSSPEPGRRWVHNFSLGFEYYLAGFKFISLHPRLFKYILIPLVICFLIFGGMVTGGVLSIDWALGFLEGDWGWLQWLHSLVYWLLYLLMLLLILLVSFFLTLVLSTIINSPFYDFLSERVEEVYLGRRFDEPWSWEYVKRTILVPIRESLKLALYQTVLTLGLFAVSLISGGLGTVIFALVAPYIAALGIFDFVMARKIYSLAEKRAFLRQNLPFAMGFGTLAYFLPLLTPFAIVGATLGFLASRDK